MKTIKDSVHDHIEVGGVARALLDTPEVQRLRHVKQLGTVSLVYPSANHTRFEHSLGVYHLACEALSQLGIEGRAAERVRAAAILHDVGHGPYSHNVEDVIERHTGKYHEDVEDVFADSSIPGILAEYDLDPDRVADLVCGEGTYGGLVSGELDVDRMDYLVRDAHHTGVPYGTIDHGRLVRELRFVDDELVLGEGNVQTAESLLVARALMNPTVYSHHVARIGKSMLRRGAERLIEAGTDPETLRRMDDHDLLVALRTTASTGGIARRLAHRDLFKRAVWAELRDVPRGVLDPSHESVVEYERDVADRAGVDADAVILDVPGYPKMTESSTRVVVGGEIRRLDEQSPLVRTLRQSQLNQWRLGVYAPADVADRVGHAAEAVLGLDTDGTLVSDVAPGLHTTLDRFGSGAE
ncbi:HD domain-containing protein [Halalkalicoccus sp. NIPERK01]|uniref:HD domain-containing protein n=1 Tax=Halalkalicoccus sp. NIPERK01 TaxID=3053469 RepID=UPI00256F5EE8|nr:HD domain-containing protein [Halalkalicoccus sp. NIPERK01]MDL5361437.1 HD domain-containing protein [Halalkalicoccus sp. NIPERK01]